MFLILFIGFRYSIVFIRYYVCIVIYVTIVKQLGSFWYKRNSLITQLSFTIKYLTTLGILLIRVNSHGTRKSTQLKQRNNKRRIRLKSQYKKIQMFNT